MTDVVACGLMTLSHSGPLATFGTANREFGPCIHRPDDARLRTGSAGLPGARFRPRAVVGSAQPAAPSRTMRRTMPLPLSHNPPQSRTRNNLPLGQHCLVFESDQEDQAPGWFWSFVMNPVPLRTSLCSVGAELHGQCDSRARPVGQRQ